MGSPHASGRPGSELSGMDTGNVQFSLNADNRRDGGIAGTATGQRGNNGRAYDFEVRCSVNPDNGNIRSLQVNRR